MEKKHQESSTGSFLYKEQLQHAKISQPVDSFLGAWQVPEQDIYTRRFWDVYFFHQEKNMYLDKHI